MYIWGCFLNKTWSIGEGLEYRPLSYVKQGWVFFAFWEIVTGWLVLSTGQKILLAEIRFLQVGKGAENTKEKSRQCFKCAKRLNLMIRRTSCLLCFLILFFIVLASSLHGLHVLIVVIGYNVQSRNFTVYLITSQYWPSNLGLSSFVFQPSLGVSISTWLFPILNHFVELFSQSLSMIWYRSSNSLGGYKVRFVKWKWPAWKFETKKVVS
jgi:hypothetical protein